MKILAIEATGNTCSIALWKDERLYQKTIESPQKQGEHILPMIEEALKAANLAGTDLDVIAFDNGPGSFTGVRLTISVAQGLAFGWGKPVMPISSLQALAYKKYGENKTDQPIWVAIDARKQEVYVAAYQFQPDGIVVVHPEQVIAPEQVPTNDLIIYSAPDAADLLAFAQYQLQQGVKPILPEEIQPTYLRNKVTD